MLTSHEHPIIMPEIGAGTWRISVSSWLAELGEVVREGDRLVEVSIPGITFDVIAPAEGRLVEIEKRPGDEVRPGDLLGKLDSSL